MNYNSTIGPKHSFYGLIAAEPLEDTAYKVERLNTGGWMEQSKQWVFNKIFEQENPGIGEKVRKLSKQCNISPLLAKVFLSRGIEEEEYIEKFLNPSMDDLHDPFLLKDMEKAVDRIIDAVKNGERIVIFGDYDVDGVTSTSILYDFLKTCGAHVGYYIPDRKEEGYGLSMGAVQKVIDGGASLIITVDCGITAFEEVKYIVENHVDIIITDHHECKEELPEAYASVNPCRHDSTYPFKELAGVGVVFKLVKALSIKMGLEDPSLKYIDLVALGTVADVVTLSDENRVIVKYGVKAIENTSNKGLKALIDASGVKDKLITAFTIGFVLAPRINAAGRIGDATRAVRLLTTDDENEAIALSKELNEQNSYRQETEQGILCDVLSKIEYCVDLKKEKVIVVWGKEWHHGIIGIVASRITEIFHRPCILIAVEEGLGKGSGRSIEGFNLFEALSHCASLFEKFGGHELAAGLTIKEENIEEFKRLINEYANSLLKDSDLIPKLKIDVEVTKEDISTESVRELELLSPFGVGNPSPVFAYRNLTIEEIRKVGSDKHLKLKLKDKGTVIDAIGFNRGHLAENYNEKDVIDVACSFEINTWNNVESVQMNLKDLRDSEDVVTRNKFYYSLDKAIDFTRVYDDKKINLFLEEVTRVNSLEELGQDFYKDLKTVFLVNSMSSLKELADILDGVKAEYGMAYGELDEGIDGRVCVLVNAVPDSFDDVQFDRVIVFGEWISRNYLYSIIGQVESEKLFILDKICFKVDVDDIIVERRDFVAVYQFVKNNFGSEAVIEDLFRFARVISKKYGINMNYFKVKRIIETFEELNLFKKWEYGKYGMKISIMDTKGKKADLDSSAIFQSFKAFRQRIHAV